MAKKKITIAGIGPFVYDDSEHKAIETEGEVDAEEINLVKALQKDVLDIASIATDLDVERLIVTLDFH